MPGHLIYNPLVRTIQKIKKKKKARSFKVLYNSSFLNLLTCTVHALWDSKSFWLSQNHVLYGESNKTVACKQRCFLVLVKAFHCTHSTQAAVSVEARQHARPHGMHVGTCSTEAPLLTCHLFCLLNIPPPPHHISDFDPVARANCPNCKCWTFQETYSKPYTLTMSDNFV